MVDEESQGVDFEKLVSILKRRLLWIVVPAIIMSLLGLGISYKVTPKYVSGAFVLVEQPKVPDQFVTPVVTNTLEARLMTLKEQMLSRSRLEPIITRLSLYDDHGNLTMEEKVTRLRKAIDVRVLRAEGPTPSGFYISAEAGSGKAAQTLCSEILFMFMDGNLRVRQQEAAGTTAFLADQLQKSKRKLDEQDAKLADFKRRYIGQLPGDEQRNLEMLNSTRARLEAVNQELMQVQQQKVLQESSLAQQLRASALSTNSGTAPTDLSKHIAELQSQLAMLQGRYTNENPDVIKLRTQIQSLQKQLANSKANEPTEPSAEDRAVETPEIRQARTAIRLNEQAIQAKSAEQARLQRDIAALQGRLQLSPSVEEQYKALTRDYETALQFYNDLLHKKTLSEEATDLERRQEGEQFRLMDAPDLPAKPSFPNRAKFAGGGLAAGLALGIGLAFLIEGRQKFLRTEADVVTTLELPVLIALPVFTPDGQSSRVGTSRLRRQHRQNRAYRRKGEV